MNDRPQTSPETAQAVARLLAWYAEIGAVGTVAETAINWQARGDRAPGADYRWPAAAPRSPEPNRPPEPARAPASPSAPPPQAAPPTSAPPAATRPSPAAAAAPTRRPPLAMPPSPAVRAFDAPTVRPTTSPGGAGPTTVAARSLADLGAELSAFEGCGLKATAKRLCLYRGAETARVMVIGEAPGKEEDATGQPFVGPAGQLLDRMLAAIGLGPDNVHITNVVYWRPPGNRTPTPVEALACAPFLTRQIELVQPTILLLMGGVAAKHVLDTETGIMRLRGRWHDLSRGGRALRVMPTLHPAYLLRSPAAKRQAWRDLLTLAAALDTPDGGG